MKTLYVSDLDGTLLSEDSVITPASIDLINRSIVKGAHFTIATARNTAMCIGLISQLDLTWPIILMNGALVYDLSAERYLQTEAIPPAGVLAVVRLLDAFDVHYFLYSLSENELILCHGPLQTRYEREFFLRSQNLQGIRLVETANMPVACSSMPVIYISIVGEYLHILPVMQHLGAICEVNFACYLDAYLDGMWNLEIFGSHVDKAGGVAFLKQYGGFDRVCVFGDNLNDINMFHAADYACAVGNAVQPLKDIADCVIGLNSENSVAEWLSKQFY
jgi:5-amino-6-(5-phospho-D-ribitylamino)uracil phosphatase